MYPSALLLLQTPLIIKFLAHQLSGFALLLWVHVVVVDMMPVDIIILGNNHNNMMSVDITIMKKQPIYNDMVHA